jgi:hypothetical protein
LNLLTVRDRFNGDGLKVPIAASAGESQGSYRQEEEENERPKPVHGEFPLDNPNLEEVTKTSK